MKRSKATAVKLTAAERRAKALEARKAGFTYQAIGDSLGITQQAAHKTVMVALAVINEKIAEAAEEVRTIELERIDALFKIAYQQGLKGKRGAVMDCVRLMDRRAKYLGLDAPLEIKHVDWRIEAIELIKDGKLKYNALEEEFGESLAKELFITAGVKIAK